ncbi:MAG: ABC transporter permease [Pseudomonadota bacterium]
MIILRLAWQSLLNRKVTVLLTVLSIAISVALLVGVEKVRTGAKESFLNTISGTDLVVGSRAGAVQLLLYSVFRMGDATANITWETVEAIKRRPEVDWVVPIALGDSHRGFRVMGTSQSYFEHYRYRRNVPLTFGEGRQFEDLFDAVVGAEVAERLNYKVGDQIVVAHGGGRISFGQKHDDKPFTISGILAPTGTPVDKTVHISMEAMEAIHVGWESGSAPRGDAVVSAEQVRTMDLSPKSATALYVGLKSRMMTFSLQRWVNTYRQEAVTAILPGVAFGQLWSILGNVETALLVISSLVVFTALLGMMISILGSLNERRREMAIMRAIGARPAHVFGLFTAEAAALVIAGALLGLAIVYTALAVSRPFLESMTGLDLPLGGPNATEFTLIFAIVIGGILAGVIPALRAYSLSLSDGLTVRT